MITKEDIKLDYIPEEGELCYVSDNIYSLVNYVNKKTGCVNFMKNEYPYETVNGTEWKYAYPVNGYKYEKIETEKTTDEWKPKRGDIIEVSDSGINWSKRIFLTEIEGAVYPCVVVSDEDDFKRGEEFSFSYFKFMRKLIQKTTLTKAQIAEQLNIPVEELEIID